jgi:hypothetical protein
MNIIPPNIPAFFYRELMLFFERVGSVLFFLETHCLPYFLSHDYSVASMQDDVMERMESVDAKVV